MVARIFCDLAASDQHPISTTNHAGYARKSVPSNSVTFRRRPSTYAKDSIVHILVLGSGYGTDDRLSYSGQLYSSGLARLVEGIRLYNLMHVNRLIYTGYADRQPLPQAKISAFAAQGLGIDSTVIDTLCSPWNTRNEAEEYLKRFGKSCKLYLVTDAAHMPRAIMHFRNAGLKPIPAPANFMIRKNSIHRIYSDYFPGSYNIRFMEIVFQEYLGMLWATMRGNYLLVFLIR